MNVTLHCLGSGTDFATIAGILTLTAAFTCVANEALMLNYNGTNWVEIQRQAGF
jgi:hypothetical protein